MARTVKPQDLERLVAAQRRLKIALVAVLVGLVGVIAVFIKTDLVLPIPICVGLGLGIGRLTSTPYRNLVSELGLTLPEANAILTAERERHNGLAALSPSARADRETRTARILLGVALLFTVALVAAASYFIRKAGQTVDENAPTDIWFAISAFGGFACLVIIPSLLFTATHLRKRAAQWRAQSR